MIEPSKKLDNNKNSSWLNNSTFRPVKILEYSDEEISKEIDYHSIINSDLDEERTSHKKRKEKKKRHKKIKKSDVVKHYLKQLPSISDEKCMFRKTIFLDELPREERKTAFFVDQHGNPYISQFGSICEKHVPKYRAKKQLSFSNVLSDRYYSILKGITSEITCKTDIKRKCDSHCICQQSFIPIPYDIDPYSYSLKLDDQEIIDEVAEINENINKDPHNIKAWLSLINVQTKGNQMGISSSLANSIVVEKRLMIVEKALKKNASNLQLHLLRLSLIGNLWPIEKIQKEWNQLLFVWNTNIDVWRFYINQIERKSLGFSVDKVIGIYTKCFSTFFNIMSGRMKTKNIDSSTVMDLCDLFADYCDYLLQSGFSERAIASWQIVVEYNFFCGDFIPKQSGNILEDPMLKALHQHWSSCLQHIGQPDFKGWVSPQNSTSSKCPLQSHLQQIITDTESELIKSDDNETQIWLQLEKSRQQTWWIPYSNNDEDQEDPDRIVPFSAIQSCLISIHGLCNLSDGSSSVDVSLQAKQRLLLLFFDHLGVFNPSVSIKYNISSAKIRDQQMKIDQIIYASKQTKRIMLPSFIKNCFHQLRGILNSDFSEDLSRLELSYAIYNHLSAKHWKEALIAIRQSAKSILSRSSNVSTLWIDYGQTLLRLADNVLFVGSEKALKALFNEANKVIQALQHQVSSTMQLELQVSIITLSINISIKQISNETYNQVSGLLYKGTFLFSQQYFLNPPQDTLASICLSQSEIINLVIQNPPMVSNWHFILYLHAASRLLLINVEAFNVWMCSDCLRIIKDLGLSSSWSNTFLYQLSYFLEIVTSFFTWYVSSRGFNESALLRTFLSPFIKMLTLVQTTSKYQTVDIVLSPRLIQLCMYQRSSAAGQRLSVRNFLWSIVGSSESDTTVYFNYVSHGTSLMLLNMELERWSSLLTSEDKLELFTGRSDRVRSTFNRLLQLRCMHWKFRLTLWLIMMEFEAKEISPKCEERTKGVFYRAVTDMPGLKVIYMTAVSLVPSLLDEAIRLMKNNGLRVCTPLEEIKLLLRIRESMKPKE